ncbi:AAA family ATPase [Endothiovibrio diazotrophicus]
MTKERKNELRALRRTEIDRLDRAAATAFPLPARGSWPATRYLLEAPAVDALIAALAAGKPLLVQGEPGIGKSQLARAAAEVLGRPFIYEVIQPDTEYTDLLWRIDHTSRLADAQLAGSIPAARGSSDGEAVPATPPRDVRNVAHYIGPGPIWWALDARSGEAQHTTGAPNFVPDPPLAIEPCARSGVVLLLDEIDKADISLTNGLLEVLGNGGFNVPPLGRSIASAGPPPLVVLTSNNSRELPPALLRRCVVLSLSLGKDVQAHLERIGAVVFPDLEAELRSTAAAQIVADRNDCTDLPRTGLAEYLDLLRALDELAGDGDDPAAWLTRLGHYFHKSRVNPDQP